VLCKVHNQTKLGLARSIHTYTGHVGYAWQGSHQIDGHIRCVCTVLANPKQNLCH